MQLNMDKTCIMHMNTPVPLPIYYFTPLTPNTHRVKVVYAAKYLNISINENGILNHILVLSWLQPDKASTNFKDFGRTMTLEHASN